DSARPPQPPRHHRRADRRQEGRHLPDRPRHPQPRARGGSRGDRHAPPPPPPRRGGNAGPAPRGGSRGRVDHPPRPAPAPPRRPAPARRDPRRPARPLRFRAARAGRPERLAPRRQTLSRDPPPPLPARTDDVSEIVLLAASVAYLALVFAIASWGDRRPRPARAPIVYALGLGVYCTSWTFYGAVGEAARSGLDYLAIYVGPALLMLFGWPILARMIRIARAENVVSISDFISARYGKSRGLAALVTLSALLALLPYFALQLKGITISFEA